MDYKKGQTFFRSRADGMERTGSASACSVFLGTLRSAFFSLHLWSPAHPSGPSPFVLSPLYPFPGNSQEKKFMFFKKICLLILPKKGILFSTFIETGETMTKVTAADHRVC